VDAALRGGVLIREKSGTRAKDSKVNAKDLVTEVDTATQELIEAVVGEAFPNHGTPFFITVHWRAPAQP
jgi:fructose-1,6-bisphosphatase/inositol monophosphatase family enzyme